MITLVTLKCFGIFGGETDFDVTINARQPPSGELRPLGLLNGTYSSNSFKVKMMGMRPVPGGPMTLPIGSISANY